jgi:uncharacterized membrane protein YeaQ/YmgE (transglycosylase-associated protein family)
MKDPQIGWIAAIIIGAVAGWLAEQFMKSDMGLLMNIVLGIIGAAVASAILSVFGIQLGGWLGYLIAGFIGACLLIWIVRAVRGGTPPAGYRGWRTNYKQGRDRWRFASDGPYAAAWSQPRTGCCATKTIKRNILRYCSQSNVPQFPHVQATYALAVLVD